MGIFGIFLFIFNRKYERALFKYKRNGSIRRLNYSAIYSITGFILGSINMIKKSNIFIDYSSYNIDKSIQKVS